MSDASKRLAKIASTGEQKARLEEYKNYLQELIDKKASADVKALVEHITADAIPLVISRQVLDKYAPLLPTLEDDLHVELAQFSLEKIQPRVVAFEDQISTIRENLAEVFERREEFLEAAKVLMAIPLESQRNLPAEVKADKYVKIAQLFLEEDEHFEAERFVTKASVLIPDLKGEKNITIVIRYKSCFARIAHFKRKFLEAAMRFYELSQILFNQPERMQALKTAVICVIMAPAGPQRSQQLAKLYKDERSKEIECYPILEKMFLDRILRKHEFDSFVAFLKREEQPIPTIDSTTTVLDKAVREHNLLSASKVYNNIRFDELAVLLDVEADDAEKLASTMITEDRLQGHIDQLERVIYFQEENALNLWDAHIEKACSSVNGLIDLLQQKYPKFTEQF